MKKVWIIVIAALVLGIGGGYLFFNSKKSSVSAETTTATPSATNKTSQAAPSNFQWGVTMGPSDLGNYQPEIWQLQINLVKQLGAGWIRLRWDSENADPFKRNDEEINMLSAYGLNTLLIIEQDPRKDGKVDNYQDGLKDGTSISEHYKGKIKYYQLVNEGGAQSIKNPTWSGQKADEYDATKYKKVRDYLKGLSDGIAKGDPNAKRVVTISFTHTGYLDKLVQDKVNFDIIGIDWYDWMGPIEKKKLSGGTFLVDKLKSFNKPLIFAEVNAVPEADSPGSKRKTKVNENKQSDFIKQTAEWAFQNREKYRVQGFYVLSLLDGINNHNENVEYYGIVAGARSKSGAGVPGIPRKSFYTYQEIIKKYTQK